MIEKISEIRESGNRPKSKVDGGYQREDMTGYVKKVMRSGRTQSNDAIARLHSGGVTKEKRFKSQ